MSSVRVGRRRALQMLGLGVAAVASARTEAEHADVPPGPRPTREQLAWQESELTMFCHFGMNTFTGREWGDGTEDPRIFDPSELDAHQWASAARDAGFRYFIFTAKHHDGFCLWPSRHTEHSVRHSPWRGGRGDLVREVADACRAAGLRLGIYLSPWDRHERTYGDSPTYNAYFRAQLEELLTQYGPVAEVWFDGACGEGPNGKRQEYDWPSFYEVVRRRQPGALIAVVGPDVRWVGNEEGVARETEWSVQPAVAGSRAIVGDQCWYPAESNTSIRPGWFWHAAEDDKVKSLDHLTDIYYRSVGRNSVLLLNVPPNRRGLFPDPDVTRLRELRQRLDRSFGVDLARGARVVASSTGTGSRPGAVPDGRPRTHWAPAEGQRTGWLELTLRAPATFDVVMLQEHIALGQYVEDYAVDAWDGADWRPVCRGTTIGHKKLDRVAPVTAARIRVSIGKSRARPHLRAVGLFRSAT